MVRTCVKKDCSEDAATSFAARNVAGDAAEDEAAAEEDDDDEAAALARIALDTAMGKLSSVRSTILELFERDDAARTATIVDDDAAMVSDGFSRATRAKMLGRPRFISSVIYHNNR